MQWAANIGHTPIISGVIVAAGDGIERMVVALGTRALKPMIPRPEEDVGGVGHRGPFTPGHWQPITNSRGQLPRLDLLSSL